MLPLDTTVLKTRVNSPGLAKSYGYNADDKATRLNGQSAAKCVMFHKTKHNHKGSETRWISLLLFKIKQQWLRYSPARLERGCRGSDVEITSLHENLLSQKGTNRALLHVNNIREKIRKTTLFFRIFIIKFPHYN